MKKRQGQKGFTLIELMIVVAVIGVLSAIAVPQYQNYVKKAAIGVGLANIAALKTNIEDFIATEGEFPTVVSGGAVSFARLGTFQDLGDGKVAIDQGSTSAAGSVLYTLDDGNASGQKIQLRRDDNGLWVCETTADSALAPANCTPSVTL
ncbi:pilin [Aliivibrio fischeri]|uniref:pilin n=1 Tax=Aliivibrio fischeri TaxID=668 RepID=UPI00080D98BF|nr:pilin [Aliivibrio fischeri]MUL18696.1 prepilin-type N-terminal cleavage/methylation domain-containing protein [Aliivibrio fischeri]OCH25591.1 prepilin-type N-terminal cleavage/methylation domain-containing protein [Aliivibrio fischeri]